MHTEVLTIGDVDYVPLGRTRREFLPHVHALEIFWNTCLLVFLFLQIPQQVWGKERNRPPHTGVGVPCSFPSTLFLHPLPLFRKLSIDRT